MLYNITHQWHRAMENNLHRIELYYEGTTDTFNPRFALVSPDLKYGFRHAVVMADGNLCIVPIWVAIPSVTIFPEKFNLYKYTRVIGISVCSVSNNRTDAEALVEIAKNPRVQQIVNDMKKGQFNICFSSPPRPPLPLSPSLKLIAQKILMEKIPTSGRVLQSLILHLRSTGQDPFLLSRAKKMREELRRNLCKNDK